MTDLISREEAIEYLMTNMIWYDEFGYEEDDADLKRAAIAGLIDGIPSAQQNAEDLISRQVVLDLIDCWTYDLCDKEDVWAATQEIENLPSEQKRKTGEWEVAIGYDPKKKVMCTNCRLMSYEPTRFCPHCGVWMKNGDE